MLGSGLGGFAGRLVGAAPSPTPRSRSSPSRRSPGHAGRLVLGELPGGSPPSRRGDAGPGARLRGLDAEDVAFGARVLCRLGVKALVVTNAAGGVNPASPPATWCGSTDHLNLSGQNPLAAPTTTASARASPT